MAARYAAGSDMLGSLVRKRQDLERSWQALDVALTKAVSQTPEKRRADVEARLRQELSEIDSKIRAVNEQLLTDFPRFTELSSVRPATTADVQSTLRADEALVAWTVGDDESYTFVVRKDREPTYFRVRLSGKQIREIVSALRDSLDLKGRVFAELPPFDTAKAYELYRQLLAPAEGLLAGAKTLVIVPDDGLQSLPPALLVTEKPLGRIADFADYASVRWLARSYATSILPAVSSLSSLRRFANTRHSKDPFVGFGNPQFQPDLQLAPLPETAHVLRAEADALGAPPLSVHLGRDATVSSVKGLDLSDTRVVAFATHGLVAGPTLPEPALALTPSSKDDEGLLRASEVSELKLNADWVLLSACNTAASDGTPGAEGLSGLPKHFSMPGPGL
jgi:CHAT domain-containing protein